MDLIIKGFIIGIGKILPGISGSLLAITLGIYEKIIETISNLKKDLIKNIIFLSKISIGIIIAIIIFSKIIVKCINNYYFPTMLLFIGMIIGVIPKIVKQTKLTKTNIKISVITIIIILIILKVIKNNLNIINNHVLEYTIEEFIKLMGIGIIDAITSIIPGISGTAILMSIGYYNIIITSFSNVTQIEKLIPTIFVLIPFGIGFLIGTIYISKIISIIFKHNKNILNILSIVFMTITTIILTKKIFETKYTVIDLIVGIILFIIGITTTIYINKNNKE